MARITKILYIDFDNVLQINYFKENIFIVGIGGLSDRITLKFRGNHDIENIFLGFTGLHKFYVVLEEGMRHYYFSSIEDVSLHHDVVFLDGVGLMVTDVLTLPKFYLVNERNIVDLEAQGYDVEEPLSSKQIENIINNIYIDLKKTSLYIKHLPTELKYRLLDLMNEHGKIPKSIVAELKSYDGEFRTQVRTEGI